MATLKKNMCSSCNVKPEITSHTEFNDDGSSYFLHYSKDVSCTLSTYNKYYNNNFDIFIIVSRKHFCLFFTDMSKSISETVDFKGLSNWRKRVFSLLYHK